jgi:tetratricopeptide (TPR) repeat protein
VRHALAADLPDRALGLSIAAGDDALRMCAARDAIAHYERARALSPSSPDPHVLLQLGRAYELATEFPLARMAYAVLLDAARAVADARIECAALNRLATLTEVGGYDLTAQAAYLEAAQAAADASGDLAGQAETAWNLSRLGVYRLELGDAREQAARALSLARELGLTELSGRVLNWTAMIERLSGDWRHGLEHVQQARAIFATLGDKIMEADCLAIQAGLHTVLGQPREAVVIGRAAYELNIEMNNGAGQADAGEELAVGLFDRGDYLAALDVIHAAIAAARAISHAPSLITSIALLGSIHRTLGDLDAALAAHAEAWSLAAGVDYALFTEHVAAELCADHAVRGDWHMAVSQARVAMQARRRHTAVYVGRVRWYETEALVRAGEVDIAAEDVRQFGQQVGDTSRFRIAYLRAEAVVSDARGQAEAAISALEQARALAETCGLPGEMWPIDAALERLYRARGAEDQAREVRAEATRILQDLATPLSDPDMRAAFVRAAAATMEG